MDCNVRCCAAVIFVAIVATLTSKGTGCVGLTQNDPSGHTVPSGDIFIKYGDPLRIVCNVDSTSYNSSSIVFTKLHGDKPELIDSEYVRILNSTAVELLIEKPSPVQEATYTCVVKKKNFTKENFQSHIIGICPNSVTVGLAPQEVGNLSCVSHNWDSLNCSWKGPQNYDTTSYDVSYTVKKSNEHRCPKVTKSGDWYNCVWNKSTTPIYRQPYEVITLILTASNRFGRKTWNWSINHFANVLPDSPQDLTYNASDTNITLSWRTPSGLENFPPGLVYELIYRSPYSVWQKVDTVYREKGKLPINVTLVDLFPFTTYDVRIRCRSGKNDDNLWSEYASVNITTKAAIPNKPPRTELGSFAVSSLDKGQQIVVLYWQKLQPFEENGRNLQYKVVKIEVSGVEIQMKESQKADWFVSYAGLTDETYKFYIKSENDVGECPYASEIVVPSSRIRPPAPEAVTKSPYTNGTYEISWRVIDRSDITGFTVFWCKGRSDVDPCTGYLNWTKVDRSTFSKSITLPDDSLYQFAVSTEAGTLSSGLSWVSCTNLPDGLTGSKLKQVEAISTQSNSIRLAWKPAECADKMGVVHGYSIKYCVVPSFSNCVSEKCHEECNNLKFLNVTDPSAVHGNLSDLEPYSTYNITVAVITKSKIGFESDPILVTTAEASPDKIEKVTVGEVTNSSIAISWLMPSRQNGIIRHYIVYWNDEHRIIPARTSYVLTQLKSWKDYNISVSACTLERSCSVRSDVTHVRTRMGHPGPPLSPNISFSNSTELVIKWSPPSDPSGIIAHYDVLVEFHDNGKYFRLPISNINNSLSTKININLCKSPDTASNIKMDISVRAINIDIYGNVLEGKWSGKREGSCLMAHARSPEYVILISVVGLGAFCILCAACIWMTRIAWLRCKDMREVGIKLPERLKPRREVDKTDSHSLEPWGYEPKDLQNPKPSPDQQLLLDRKLKEELEEEGTCADESGCGSGQESVSSVGSDARISADSGTEADSGDREGSPSPSNAISGVPADSRGGTAYVSLPPPAAVPRPGYVTIAPFSGTPVTPDPGYVIVGAPSSPLPISPMPVSPLPVPSVSPMVVSPVAPSYCVLGLKQPDNPKSLQSFSDLIQDDVLSSLHSN